MRGYVTTVGLVAALCVLLSAGYADASVPLGVASNSWVSYGGAFGTGGGLDPTGGQLGAMSKAIGDLDSDGLPELAVSDPGADPVSGENAGSVYVIFSRGGLQRGPVDLGLLPNFGSNKLLRIDGAAGGDRFGYSIAVVADSDGDGKKELLVGAPNADADGRTGVDSGRAYLITGQALITASESSIRTITTLMSSITNWGYAVTGTYAGTDSRAAGRFGIAVGSVGDMNGDGQAELLASDGGANSGGGVGNVIFGQTISSPDIDLASGFDGWLVTGPPVDTFELGDAIVGMSDVGGPSGAPDGIPDIAISDPKASFATRFQSGIVYVIYGKSGGSTVDLTALTASAGYRIGGAVQSQLGLSQQRRSGLVSELPDMSGDGLSEVAIGAIHDDNNSRVDSGSLFVLYRNTTSGGTGDIDLTSSPGAGSWSGMRIDGAVEGGGLGYAGDPIDMNADSIPDPLVGAPSTDRDGSPSGDEYVVYGSRTSKVVDLVQKPANWGWSIEGTGNASPSSTPSALGASAVGVGDWNHDGMPDIAVGDTRENFNGLVNAGVFRVVTQRPIPVARSAEATDVTETTATLGGYLSPLNFGPTTFHFELGKTDAYGFSTSDQSAANQGGTLTVNSSITNLESCTTYHYRLVGKNDDGFSAIAPDATFQTGCVTDSEAQPTDSVATPSTQMPGCDTELYAAGNQIARSKITQLGKYLFRIAGPEGGFIKAGAKSLFALEYNAGGEKSLRTARFAVDGETVATLEGLPFAIKLNTQNMIAEIGKGVKHRLTVKLTPKSGKSKTLKLSFRVGSCSAGGLTTAITRTRDGKASVKLTIKAGQSSIKTAKIKLPAALKPSIDGGRRVGTLTLTQNGKQAKKKLSVPSKTSVRSNSVKLASNAYLVKARGKWELRLKGLGSVVTKAQLEFSSSAGLFTIKERCFSLKFKTSLSGGADSKQSTSATTTYKASCKSKK